MSSPLKLVSCGPRIIFMNDLAGVVVEEVYVDDTEVNQTETPGL